MQKNECKMTIYFEDPFWVGIYERVSEGILEVCKITFGAEPKEAEVLEYLLKNWHSFRFSPPVKVKEADEVRRNSKRMRRSIKKQLEKQGIGTKSQQALALQREENKIIRRKRSREQREAEKQLQFELHCQKRKQKHKGH